MMVGPPSLVYTSDGFFVADNWNIPPVIGFFIGGHEYV